MSSERGATQRWRTLPQRAATFERVLSLLIVARFKPRWARDGEEGEDDIYDRFIGGGRWVLRKASFRPSAVS